MSQCFCCCCNGCQQPVNTSGPAICAASCITTGTQDTLNALIASGTSTLAAIFGAKQQEKATAVKAQVQLAKQKTDAIMWVVIAAVAVLGFFAFANSR